MCLTVCFPMLQPLQPLRCLRCERAQDSDSERKLPSLPPQSGPKNQLYKSRGTTPLIGVVPPVTHLLRVITPLFSYSWCPSCGVGQWPGTQGKEQSKWKAKDDEGGSGVMGK